MESLSKITRLSGTIHRSYRLIEDHVNSDLCLYVTTTQNQSDHTG